MMYGLLYLLAYLMGGCLIVRFLLPRHSPLTRLWLGASLGLLMMMWLPALMAFFMDFTMQAQQYALIPLGALVLLSALLRDRRKAARWDAAETSLLLQMLLVVVPLTVLSGYLQYTHCVRVAEDGSWWGGQSTYGDLAMHMSFVTSLKNASFPPEYALFPGQQLSYPFLTDSLSTTFYLFGWTLQLSLTVPGTLMMALCYMGVMCLARRLTAGKRTVILAALLFFLNGGLGFIYDLDLAGGTEAVWQEGEWVEVSTLSTRVESILTGYYTTPTNQPTPNNLRWSNVIADLMLPQRTLLGGWCMVIPCFYLLFSAFGAQRPEGHQGRAVMLLGLWGGALPLIHTHSFLALGLCSLGLMTYDLLHAKDRRLLPMAQRPAWLRIGVSALLLLILTLATAGLAAMSLTDLILPDWALTALPLGCAGAMLLVLFGDMLLRGLLCPARPEENAPSQPAPLRLWHELGWYLLYGGLACLLAIPQLLGFTFNQVFQEGMEGASNSFLQPWFNWVNSTDGSLSGMIDGYGWFYVKNIGLPFLMLIFALFERNPRWRRIFAGALPIVIAAECIRFQPNIYDNNKLLYLAWLLCAMVVADWCRMLWQRMKGLRARPVIALLAAVTIFLSAGLTLWREVVSSYQLFSAGAVETGEYIRDNTEEDAVFLTGVHHLNPVSSIAGRTIVCGPDLWLYYHGLDTSERKADITRFYLDPVGNADVLTKYGVDYIVVSSYERADYAIYTPGLSEVGEIVYQSAEATIWKVKAELPAPEVAEDAETPPVIVLLPGGGE